MAGRERIDPDTSRVVEQRLQRLLQENGPVPTHGTRAARVPDPELAENEPAEDGRAEEEQGSAQVSLRWAPRPASSPRTGVAAAGSAVVGIFGSLRRLHVVIVAAIVVLGILLAGWAVLRARPVAVAVTPPAVESTASPARGPSSAGKEAGDPAASESAAEVMVHVLGAVRKPGVVKLAAGSRVQDALQKAGGLTGKADPGELNLAQPVADGQQIVVGTKGKPNGQVRDGTVGGSPGGATGSGGSSGGGSGGEQTVNLNTATQAQLEELPGVGPVMAGKIIAWRTENGRFSRVEELQEISGVGPKTYARLAPLCRV